jgi:hypothetical protein
VEEELVGVLVQGLLSQGLQRLLLFIVILGAQLVVLLLLQQSILLATFCRASSNR